MTARRVISQASELLYDNDTSGLAADDVQEAIDELVTDLLVPDGTTIEESGSTFRIKDKGVTAAKMGASGITAGYVPTADGSGNVSWDVPPTAGGAAPTGAAGGDLAGTYPNPTLDKTKAYFAAQMPSLVCWGNHPGFAFGATAGAINTANKPQGFRVIIPRSGTLNDLYIYVANQSGNIEVGILDTTATTRNRLWTSGSIACPGTGWQKIGDPGLSVVRGDHLDFYIAADNTTATFLRPLSIGISAASALPSAFIPCALGGKPTVMWQGPTGFPLGSQLAETNMSAFNTCPTIIARVA